MANLGELIQKLKSNSSPYTALTDDQIKQQAANRYASTYDQYRLNAQQKYESDDAALNRQTAQLQADYDKQRVDTANQYKQTYAQTNRAALGKNMQRSSYNNATLANVDRAGLKAQQQLSDSQTKQENAIGEQRASASQQLAQQLSEYNLKEQSDVRDYADTLENREYNRLTASQSNQNSIASKIYEYQHQLEIEAEERRRFDEEIGLQRMMYGL